MYFICDRHPEVIEQLRREQQEDIDNGRPPVAICFTGSADCSECNS